MDALAGDREQLWAEAVHRFRNGEAWHLTDPDVIARAQQEQSERYETDAWLEEIATWLDRQKGDRFLTGDIMKGALEIENAQNRRADQNRVRDVMLQLGWTQGARTSAGRPWVRPNRCPAEK